jgi:hypothetical protein
MEQISIEAIDNLSSEEWAKRILGTVSRSPERPFFSNLGHNISSSPLSPFTSKVFLRSLPSSSTCTTRIISASSLLENLPNELLVPILDFLDIASLVKFASCNSKMRSFVISMPYLQTVKSRLVASSALSSMLRSGTAENFTLQEFVDTIRSSTCTICKDRATFAPWVCLILCHRVCTNCVLADEQTVRIPKKMAVDCFGLSVEDVATGAGTALAVLQPTFRRAVNPSQCGLESARIVRCDNRIDVISLKIALNLSLAKHAIVGGPNYVKLLTERYLEQHHPKLITSDRWTAITKNCRVRGLPAAIGEEWRNNSPSQHWVLTAYMPYWHPTSLPPQFETGVLCEGCVRDAVHARPPAARAAARKLAGKAYLREQYLHHLRQCETAQSIFQGERLKMSDENELKQSLLLAVSRFGGSGELQNMSGVNLDETPSEVRLAVSNALRRIHRVGNQHLQQRTSARWQTAAGPPARFGN